MIVIEKVSTEDNHDVLSATDLASIPAEGGLEIFAASKGTSYITITGPGSEPVVRNQRVVTNSSGQINQMSDIGFKIAVSQGGHYVVAMDTVGSAEWRLRAIYYDLEDLGIIE